MTFTQAIDRIGNWPAMVRYALLTGLALAFFLPGITTVPPMDRDEARFAQASKQMVQTGDIIDIRVQDQTRHKKPAGIYWLQSLSVVVADAEDAIWAYRIPSLVGAVLAVLITAWIGSYLFSPAAGIIAGALLASSVLLGVEARLAKTDAMLLASILGAIALMLRVGWRPERAPPPTYVAYAFWAVLAGGVLLKGPIIFMPVLGLLVALCLIRRDVRWLKELQPLRGFGLFLLIALPWYAAIIIMTDGQFLADSIGKDMIAKVKSGQESHGAPFGFFTALMPVTFWPGSLLILLSFPWIWWNRKRPEILMLLGWFLLVWLVVELTPTKLFHYILPAYPALALMAAAALTDTVRRDGGWWRYLSFALWALVTTLLAILPLTLGLVPSVLGLMADWGIATLKPDDIAILQATGGLDVGQAPALVGLAVLVAGFLYIFGRDRSARVFATLLVGAWAVSASIFGLTLPGLKTFWVSPAIASAIQAPPGCSRASVVTAGYSEPSLVFLTDRDILLTNGVGAAKHLANMQKCGLAIVESRFRSQFDQALIETGISATAIGEPIAGFNYAKGKTVTLQMFVAAQDQ